MRGGEGWFYAPADPDEPWARHIGPLIEIGMLADVGKFGARIVITQAGREYRDLLRLGQPPACPQVTPRQAPGADDSGPMNPNN